MTHRRLAGAAVECRHDLADCLRVNRRRPPAFTPRHRAAAQALGTGVAQPNRKGALNRSRRVGTRTVPNGSTCLSGLSVTRPSRKAVSSPSFQAAYACAASWNVIATRIGLAQVEAV